MKRWTVAALPVVMAGTLAFVRAPAPPVTHQVRMMQAGSQYKFEPANFTIKVGDIVEFINVSGGPHNVEFEKDKIPAGARDVLNRAMDRRMGDLAGPFLTRPQETYAISFAGAPKGEYHYYCLPHRALGMVGVITVQ
jgi:plastocyanin